MGLYSEISAETLLNNLHHDGKRKWLVMCEGSFYRNYSDDSMSVDTSNMFVRIARDGFLKLLPSGFISEENELRGGNFKKKYRALNKRVGMLREAFIPFDSYMFRLSLELGRKMENILERKSDLVLKTFFDFDRTNEDEYVARLHSIMPMLRQHRGDIRFVRQLLAVLLGCEVRMRSDIYSDEDTSRAFVPRIRYDLMIDGLDAGQYVSLSTALQPLCEFIQDRLMPFEAECEISVKSTERTGTILNYNIALN